jgi:hypothetical protein
MVDHYYLPYAILVWLIIPIATVTAFFSLTALFYILAGATVIAVTIRCIRS